MNSKHLNEILALCPFAKKCSVSNYGDNESCIYDFEDCKLFIVYEEEVKRNKDNPNETKRIY